MVSLKVTIAQSELKLVIILTGLVGCWSSLSHRRCWGLGEEVVEMERDEETNETHVHYPVEWFAFGRASEVPPGQRRLGESSSCFPALLNAARELCGMPLEELHNESLSSDHCPSEFPRHWLPPNGPANFISFLAFVGKRYPARLWGAAWYQILFFFTLACNGIALMVLLRLKRKGKEMYKMQALTLFNDCLFQLSNCPFNSLEPLLVEASNIFCTLPWFGPLIQVQFFLSNVMDPLVPLFNVALVVDRLQAMLQPVKYIQVEGGRRAAVWWGICAAVCAVVSAPLSVGWSAEAAWAPASPPPMDLHRQFSFCPCAEELLRGGAYAVGRGPSPGPAGAGASFVAGPVLFGEEWPQLSLLGNGACEGFHPPEWVEQLYPFYMIFSLLCRTVLMIGVVAVIVCYKRANKKHANAVESLTEKKRSQREATVTAVATMEGALQFVPSAIEFFVVVILLDNLGIGGETLFEVFWYFQEVALFVNLGSNLFSQLILSPRFRNEFLDLFRCR